MRARPSKRAHDHETSTGVTPVASSAVPFVRPFVPFAVVSPAGATENMPDVSPTWINGKIFGNA